MNTTITFKKINIAALFFILFCSTLTMIAQDNLTYQTPPKPIADLVKAPTTPGISISPDREWMLLRDRPGYPSIEEVAQKELRIGGVRLNPKTNGSSRASYAFNLRLRKLNGDKEITISGINPKAHIQNISWSPDGSRFAFTVTKENGLELWTADVASASAKKQTDAIINDVIGGTPYTWLSDNTTLIYKSIVTERGAAPEKSSVPSGPTIQANVGGEAPVRTYQDLLRNQYDETLFEHYTNCQLYALNVKTDQKSVFGKPGINRGISPSPDGNYIMVYTIERPFSYIVPYSRFPYSVDMYDKNGKLVTNIAKIPAAEEIPKGFGAVREGPRSFTWRADRPSTLYWVEAQDGGDPKKEAEFRDKMFYLEAPFNGSPKEGISFDLRYGGVIWGNDDLAMARSWWWADRHEKTVQWDPSNPGAEPKIIFDRSWEDAYTDPGDFETDLNKYGRSVLQMDKAKKHLFLTGSGASPEGNRPFIDKYNIKTQETERLWRSEAPYYEYPIWIMDTEEGVVITRRESKEDPPNYFFRNLKSGKIDAITDFPNPFEALKDVQKQFVKYEREDGVELTGTLYTPPGYDKEKDGPLPVFMWAYPREFKSAKAASQVTDSPYEFVGVYWGSPIYWVLHGYAVFDDFGMPIIGEGDEEPNETFVSQLKSGAEAAINKIVEMGVADRDRIAVGGHSYGAFMTANLLAHTDLFAAGVARSGAYNRTLTPFGFQSEERTYWEAPEIYYNMSPFMHADQVKSPLLLIHGEADNNSGTYPMQSERYYAALKGHGATVRLVMLPHESHGYRAEESILHMMWEMTEWMDKYVKNKGESKP